MSRQGSLFVFILLFAVVSSGLMMVEVKSVSHQDTTITYSSLKAMWSTVTISGESVSMQLGIAIFSLILFTTIFSIVSVKEVKENGS